MSTISHLELPELVRDRLLSICPDATNLNNCPTSLKRKYTLSKVFNLKTENQTHVDNHAIQVANQISVAVERDRRGMKYMIGKVEVSRSEQSENRLRVTYVISVLFHQ